MATQVTRGKRLQRCGGDTLLAAQPLLNAQTCDGSMPLADWACILSVVFLTVAPAGPLQLLSLSGRLHLENDSPSLVL